MTRKKVVLPLLLLVVGSTIAYAYSQMGTPPPQTLGAVEAFTFSKPTGSMTTAEGDAVVEALFNGGAMPPGFAEENWEGRVKLTDTGEGLMQTGERSWVVTIKDDPDDLSVARIYLDNQLAQRATLGNGRIIVRAGTAIATLNLLVPAAGQNFQLRVEWVSIDGGVNIVDNPVEGW